nr:MAG TPA: hypothetical protein [Caudoviricetes sp.]
MHITRKTMIDTLIEYCYRCEKCDNCELKKLYDFDVDKYTDDYGCAFEDMDDEMLIKCHNWYKKIDLSACENAEAECCDKEPDVDMVNHHKNIVEEMRRLFDLFDSNVEIFINKFNKTVDIHIQM